MNAQLLLHGRVTIPTMKLSLTLSNEKSFLISDFDEVECMLVRDFLKTSPFSQTQ